LKIFQLIDIDHSGWIDIDEMIDFMKDIGFVISDEYVKALEKK